MFKISNHICNELKDSKIIIRKLQLSQRREILDSVFKKYINISERGVCLWEKFIQYEALSDGMAWSYIRYFVKDNECIMFFNQTEEEEMILSVCKTPEEQELMKRCIYAYQYSASIVLKCFREKEKRRA